MITKHCKHCDKTFEVPQSYTKRGQGSFCSRSCAASYNNLKRPLIEHSCLNCNTTFTSKSTKALFCSDSCGNEYRSGIKPKTIYKRTTLNRKIHLLFDVLNIKLCCSICGRDFGNIDIHHIIEKSAGGDDALQNLVILCPNCHRLAHENKLKTFTSISTITGLYHIPTDIRNVGAKCGN